MKAPKGMLGGVKAPNRNAWGRKSAKGKCLGVWKRQREMLGGVVACGGHMCRRFLCAARPCVRVRNLNTCPDSMVNKPHTIYFETDRECNVKNALGVGYRTRGY